MMMKKILSLCLFTVALTFSGMAAHAQGANGRGDCKEQYSLHFYKVAPGKHDEWLTLFKKWHLPIMDYAVEHGQVLSKKFFAAGSHAMAPDWDFAAMYIKPAKAKKAPLGRADLIRKLFGDKMDEYVAAEKRRWEITLKHWDQKMTLMDPDEEPFSVYLPLGGACE